MMKPCVIENQKAWDESRHKTEYFVKALAGKDLVLCLVSAAEYLGLCSCTMELMIYTLTKEECEREGLEITFDGDIWYTTVNQTINDLLEDDTIDEQVIQEALADQYYENNYANLTIKPENQKAFEHYKEWAEQYYIHK